MFKVGFAAPYNRAQDSLNCPSENPVMLFLKDSLLKSVERKSILNLTKEIEMRNDIDYTDNPLHNADQVSNKTTQERDDVSVEGLKTRVEVLENENEGLKEENGELKEKNGGLKEENREKKRQIEAKDSRIKELLNTIEDMKKKSNVEL